MKNNLVKIAVRIVASGYVGVPNDTGNKSVDEVIEEMVRAKFPDLTDVTVEVTEEEDG